MSESLLNKPKLRALRVGVPLLVIAGLAAYAVQADVDTTVHNLLSDPTQPIPKESREVCAFCHFPQGTSDAAKTPGWSRNGNGNGNGQGAAFTTYPTLGISSPMTESTNAVGSVSLACLSCHDGTHAQNVGIGIRGDYSHPIGVAYGHGAFVRDPSLVSTDITFLARNVEDIDFKRPEVDFINRVPVWWVDTGEHGRQKTDMQLYSRIDEFSGSEMPFIECSTCHDPHSQANMFLRIQNNGSQLCRACHTL
jgi:predicted CXXCH cytochrome family protein